MFIFHVLYTCMCQYLDFISVFIFHLLCISCIFHVLYMYISCALHVCQYSYSHIIQLLVNIYISCVVLYFTSVLILQCTIHVCINIYISCTVHDISVFIFHVWYSISHKCLCINIYISVFHISDYVSIFIFHVLCMYVSIFIFRSVSNELEAECTAVLCHQLLNLGFNIKPKLIGIICPYNSQKRLLLRKLHEKYDF